MYRYFKTVRLQPAVKLKIDMFKTSMGSCLRRLRRKGLSSACLKLFSGGLVIILIFSYVSTSNRAAARNYEAVVGFVTASFEGRRKCGEERRRLLEFQVGRVRRGPRNDSLS